MNKATVFKTLGLVLSVVLCTADSGGCTTDTSSGTTTEQSQQASAYSNLINNQPAPTYDWSQEREIAIQLYNARQGAVATFSVVQSPYTGKVLWSCNSIGFPLPYSTQLTNPEFVYDPPDVQGVYVLPQSEPNGLFPPPESAATWVPCVNSKGQISPVYEEKDVTVFMQPMVQNADGSLVPVSGSTPSVSIAVGQQH